MAALELEWAFGINSNVSNCVHSLENNNKNEEIIFYPVSNNGVIYNINTKKQIFLCEHTNIITSSIISSDKNILILGDSGASNNKSIISIWNCSTYDLIETYQLPQNFGVQSLAINKKTNLLAAIINESIPSKYNNNNNNNNSIIQHLIIWLLINEENEENDEEIIEFKLLSQNKLESMNKNDLYHFITFNSDSTEIVIHGENINNFIFCCIECEQESNDEIKVRSSYYIENTDNINNIDLSTIGQLTESAFIPINDAPLITATNNGDLIIWDYHTKKSNISRVEIDDNNKHRIICKIINKITRGSINCVSILRNNDILVLASSSGCVRFYDFEFRVIGWLDYLGDQVISISFPLNIVKYLDNKDFIVPNMMIGTKNNKIIKVTSPSDNDINSDPSHNIIIDTFNIICNAMSSHPLLPLIAVGNKNGLIEIWDIINKSILRSIQLSQSQSITDIQFSPNGEWMVFGTDTHYLRIYDTTQFVEEQFFKTSYDDGLILNLCFSFNNEWMALSQSNRISVYRYWYNINDIKKEKQKEWVLIGNYISHNKQIIDIHFGIPSGIDPISQRNIPRLFSIGNDNLINEYNLQRSSTNFGLRLKYTFHLTTNSTPTTIQFIPGIKLNSENLMTYSIENNNDNILTPKYNKIYGEWQYAEDILIIFDDELKLHFYHSPRSILSNHNRQIHTADTPPFNSDDDDDVDDEEKEEIEALTFRRSILGPSFGAPIKKIMQFENNDNNNDIFCFSTYDQIIGLMQGPLNGNPYRYFGCNGHCGRINGFEYILINKYKYLITNGGYDKSLLIWKINEDILNKQIIDYDEKNNLNKIYCDLLINEEEENNDINIYQEIKNYFYFVQIENQGTISTVPRSISGLINIQQITKIFQALGCFLTKNDVERIKKEIQHRFGNNNNNNCNVKINLNQFIELFINYRSTFELSLDELHKSFMNIIGIEKNKNNKNQNKQIQHIYMTRDFFLDVLQRKGDKMSRDELMQCFQSLTGYKPKELQNIMPNQIDPEFFTKNILGLTQQQQQQK